LCTGHAVKSGQITFGDGGPSTDFSPKHSIAAQQVKRRQTVIFGDVIGQI